MIAELKVGDYIEKSELDTEQKYNDVVEVFGEWGAFFTESAVSEYRYLEDVNSLGFCKDGLWQLYSDKRNKVRKLTYDQIMSLKGKKADSDAKSNKSSDSVSVEYLRRCIDVQAERGEQYDQSGTGERSFSAAADAFNALTGEKLSGYDVCLLLTCLKVVRQNSNKSRIHDDSLLDGVSYLALWAEEISKEVD